MSSTDARLSGLRRRGTTASLLFALIGTAAGTGACQQPRTPQTRAEKMLFDSLFAAEEMMYDSATANTAFDRIDCLRERAEATLSVKIISQLAHAAEEKSASRHSPAELDAGRRGIAPLHPVGDAEHCAMVDSIWYSLVARRKSRTPQ